LFVMQLFSYFGYCFQYLFVLCCDCAYSVSVTMYDVVGTCVCCNFPLLFRLNDVRMAACRWVRKEHVA